MKIETKRLILRFLKLKDIDNLVEGIGNYDVSKWLLKVPHPYTKKDGLSFLKRKLKNLRRKKKLTIYFLLN